MIDNGGLLCKLFIDDQGFRDQSGATEVNGKGGPDIVIGVVVYVLKSDIAIIAYRMR